MKAITNCRSNQYVDCTGNLGKLSEQLELRETVCGQKRFQMDSIDAKQALIRPQEPRQSSEIMRIVKTRRFSVLIAPINWKCMWWSNQASWMKMLMWRQLPRCVSREARCEVQESSQKPVGSLICLIISWISMWSVVHLHLISAGWTRGAFTPVVIHHLHLLFYPFHPFFFFPYKNFSFVTCFFSLYFLRIVKKKKKQQQLNAEQLCHVANFCVFAIDFSFFLFFRLFSRIFSFLANQWWHLIIVMANKEEEPAVITIHR